MEKEKVHKKQSSGKSEQSSRSNKFHFIEKKKKRNTKTQAEIEKNDLLEKIRVVESLEVHKGYLLDQTH